MSEIWVLDEYHRGFNASYNKWYTSNRDIITNFVESVGYTYQFNENYGAYDVYNKSNIRTNYCFYPIVIDDTPRIGTPVTQVVKVIESDQFAIEIEHFPSLSDIQYAYHIYENGVLLQTDYSATLDDAINDAKSYIDGYVTKI